MRIECLGGRGEVVQHRLGGKAYDFKKNTKGHYTAMVNDEAHAERFLSVDGFQVYGKAAAAQRKAAAAREKAEEAKAAAKAAEAEAKRLVKEADEAVKEALAEEEALAKEAALEKARDDKSAKRIAEAERKLAKEEQDAEKQKREVEWMKKNPGKTERDAAKAIALEMAEEKGK